MESDINMMKGLEQVDSQVYKAIKKEEEEIKLCKTKKAPINVIEQYGKRLYEESLQRKMKN